MAKTQKKEMKRQWHTKEFRSSAVKMVLAEGIEAKDVASRLGIDLMTLRRWADKERQTKSSKDQESMKDLLHANWKLGEENKRRIENIHQNRRKLHFSLLIESV